MFRFSTYFVLAISSCLSFRTKAQGIPPTPPKEIVAAAVLAFPEYDSGTTFDTILKSGDNLPNPIIIPRTFDYSPRASVFGAPSYPSPHIVSLVSRSDFVGTGVPLKRWTYPLAGKSFAVSIYLVHLSGATIPGQDSLQSGRDIYIARPGGPFMYQDHAFRAIETGFPLFHLDEPYVFFGSKVITNLYKVDSDRVLKLEGNTLQETSAKHPHSTYFAGKRSQDVLNEAFAAWTQGSADRGHP